MCGSVRGIECVGKRRRMGRSGGLFGGAAARRRIRWEDEELGEGRDVNRWRTNHPIRIG